MAAGEARRRKGASLASAATASLPASAYELQPTKGSS